MEKELLKNDEFDKLIHSALSSSSELKIPPGLSETTIQRLEKKLLLRELILELIFKSGLVLLSLTILASVFVWIYGNSLLTNLYSKFISDWQIIISLFLMVFVTVLIDQIVLKYYNTIRKEISLKIWIFIFYPSIYPRRLEVFSDVSSLAKSLFIMNAYAIMQLE